MASEAVWPNAIVCTSLILRFMAVLFEQLPQRIAINGDNYLSDLFGY